MTPRNTLNIAIIHNYDKKRLLYLYPKLQELKNSLNGVINVNVEEYGFQSTAQGFRRQNFFKLVYSQFGESFRYFVANRKWERYKKNGNSMLFLSFLRQIIYFFVPIKSFNERLKRNFIKSEKNKAIFEKHLRAWTDFLETKDSQQFLLVLEDDVIFTGNSYLKFCELFDDFLENNSLAELPIFIDLAGGLELEKLKISNLIDCQSEFNILFLKPVTNTACAYILNYRTAEIFYNTISAEPRLKNFGPDWAMNMIFVKSENLFSPSLCKHYQPSVFIHGSFAGDYESSVQNCDPNK